MEWQFSCPKFGCRFLRALERAPFGAVPLHSVEMRPTIGLIRSLPQNNMVSGRTRTIDRAVGGRCRHTGSIAPLASRGHSGYFVFIRGVGMLKIVNCLPPPKSTQNGQKQSEATCFRSGCRWAPGHGRWAVTKTAGVPDSNSNQKFPAREIENWHFQSAAKSPKI